MIKHAATFGLAAALTFAVVTDGAQAGKKGRNIAIGILAGIATATVLTAAATAAQASYSYDDYSYYDDATPADNAVAACLHRAYRHTVRDGGDGIDFVALRKNTFEHGAFRVRILVNAYGPWGTARREARCQVVRDRVVDWAWKGA
jgi:hypothetical protein